MPNIPQQETIVQYIANSAQSAYTFAFYAPEDTDIEVYYQASNATPVPAADILVLNTDYTVTFNSDPITGGTITLLFTPTSGYYLTINRNVLASLNTNFAAAQTLSGATLDAAFDRLLLLCQQNQNYALERNLSYIINTYLPNATPFTQLPPLAQNYIWIGSGSGVVSALLASSPSASVLQSLLANASPGTDGARLVGYYDSVNNVSTTVHDALVGITLPAGTMLDFAGTALPTGYLLCDGSVISQAAFPALYGAIGSIWNTGGEGAGNFRLPDFSRRVAVGSGGSGTAELGNATGNIGGEESHTQTGAEVGAHNHTGTTKVKGSGNTGTFFEPLMTGANDQNVEAAASIS